MTKRPHHLRTTVLASLLMAWPLHAATQQPAPPPVAEKLSVSKTGPLAVDETIRAWFKEQDRILDEILLRLSRIENLVRELHRMIQALPVGAPIPETSLPPPPPPKPVAAPIPAAAPGPVVAPAPVAAPKPPPVAAPPTLAAPVPIPAPTAKPPPPGVLGFFDEWGNLLAGTGLLLLVLMIAARNRRAKLAAAEEEAEDDGLGIAPPVPDRLEPRSRPAQAPVAMPAPQSRPVAAPVAPTPPPQPTPRPAAPSAPPPPQADSVQDQSLELAEIMLSMGLGHGAAQTLKEQIENEPKEALRHWLRLLEVYRQNGQQEEFERSAEELRLHFNVQPEDWHMRPEDRPTLEDYPHIAARVAGLWGTPSGLTYVQNLLDDNRGGARAGFPQSVAEELLLLTLVLKANGVVPEG